MKGREKKEVLLGLVVVGSEVVVTKKVKQNSALTFRTLGIIFGQHNIHETSRTSDKDHGSGFGAVMVVDVDVFRRNT